MTSEHTAMNCIMIILVALVLNILSSLILTIKNIREWIRKRRDNALNTVAPIAAPEYNITTFQDFTIREQKIT